MATAGSRDLPAISDEFVNADLGDVRRTKRLQQIASRAEDNPDAGFPQMVASDRELEGVYRLLSNEDVSPDEVIDPHIEATLDRAEAARTTCIVIHDTTSFSFGGHARRAGLGMLAGNGEEQGFFAHVSLAVLADEARTPLGVCALRRLRRLERTGVWKHGENRQSDPNRESLRWEQQIELVEKRCNGRFSAVHVADREADIFDVLALTARLGARFVIRGHHDRTLADVEDERLLERLRTLVPLASKTIELGARHDRGRPRAQRSKHPARKARNAVVSVASCPVSLARSRHAHAEEDALDVNVVRVWEHDPIDGEPPIEWVLYTTERVDTVEQMFAVVDIYRCRWVIEEFLALLTD